MKQWLASILVTLPMAAGGSTGKAWDEFRAAVERSCRALIPASDTIVIEVNPFGSESYGAALMTVGGTDGHDRMICIFDKRSGLAEVTAPFADAAPAR